MVATGHEHAPWNRTEKAADGREVRENFARWFQDSRVVDAEGRPQVRFHASRGDFDSFRGLGTGLKLMDGLGPHFGSCRAAHDRLHKSYGKRPQDLEGASVIPVFLRIRNYPTLRTGAVMSETQLQAWLVKIAVQCGIDKHRTRAYSSACPLRRDTFLTLKSALIERGFDGLAYLNSHEDRGSVSHVVFDPHQVKSALGNSGLYTLTGSLTDPHTDEPVRETAPLEDHGTVLQVKRAREALAFVAGGSSENGHGRGSSSKGLSF